MLGSDLIVMKLKRAAKFAAVVAALAAWLAAAATSGRRTPPPQTPITKPRTDGEALASEIARLHERLRPVSSPRQPSRNLFSYSAPKEPPSLAPPAPSAALSEAAPVRAVPALKLSGIGEDETPDGLVRTAIISGLGQLFLVKEGENVTERYRVLKISSDVVELADLIDGTNLRLALR
jgi:hypothetical protein